MNNLSFGFYNGDLRSVYMANGLSKRFTVHTYNIEDNKLNNCNTVNTPEELFRKSDVIIPPVSLFINNDEAVENFCKLITNRNLVFGGCFPEKLITYFNENGIKYCDYMNNEDFVLYNTISTAEGVLAIAISETDINLNESNVLVIGYGRCAKTLIRKLQNISKSVCVTARKESDIFVAKLNGFDGFLLSDMQGRIGKYNIIINTVPAMVLKRDILCQVTSDTLIIDIASKPGGVDFDYCNKHNIKAIHALSLPGKYAPRSTARFLCNMLLRELNA